MLKTAIHAALLCFAFQAPALAWDDLRDVLSPATTSCHSLPM